MSVGHEAAYTHVVVLKVGAQDAPAEFANIGDDERGTKLCPGNKVRRFWVADHSMLKKSGLSEEVGNVKKLGRTQKSKENGRRCHSQEAKEGDLQNRTGPVPWRKGLTDRAW